MIITKWIRKDMSEKAEIQEAEFTIRAGEENQYLIGADLINKPDWEETGNTVVGTVICADGAEIQMTGEMNGQNDPYITLGPECYASDGQLIVKISVNGQKVLSVRIQVTEKGGG